jgi:hypothetical protein
MDSSDDEPSNFRNAKDFFGVEAETRDPFELSYSNNIKNLNNFETKIEDSGDESHPNSMNLTKLIVTQMAPVIQEFHRIGEETHTQLIKTTAGMHFFLCKIM